MSNSGHHADIRTRLKVAHVIRDGGGTAPVELIVAGKLRERGHQVTVYGPPEVREHASAAGFELDVLEGASAAPGEPEDLVRRMIRAALPWAEQLAARVSAADVVVADCTAFGALMAARVCGTRCAAMMPTVYVAGTAGASTAEVRTRWAAALAGINRAHSALGLDPVASVTDQILDVDRLLVLTSRAFELPDAQPPAKARYVGPQLPIGPGPSHPLPPGTEPLVIVSLSTEGQHQLDLLRRITDALDGMPVRALITVGPAIDPDDLRPPGNVQVERYVPHGAVVPFADVVVTHAGHGTVMAALSCGVPLVCLPMGRDQHAVAARVSHHGLGVTLDKEVSVDSLRTTVRRVLGDASYRTAARTLAESIESPDRVVEEIEAVAAGGPTNLPPSTGRPA